MSKTLGFTFALCAGLLLAFCSQGIADEPPSKDQTANKYRKLAQMLVSPNKKPSIENDDDSTVKFPVGYDVESQKRIEAARQVLCDNFEKTLPFLIEAIDDGRYCMTIDWMHGDGYYNYSVGKVCRDIIAANLEVYRNKIRFTGPQHWHHYDYDSITKKWWRSRKGRNLAELQVEAIDWAIKRRKAEPKDEFVEDWRNEVADLQKLRNQIAKSGKPAKPRRMVPMVTEDR